MEILHTNRNISKVIVGKGDADFDKRIVQIDQVHGRSEDETVLRGKSSSENYSIFIKSKTVEVEPGLPTVKRKIQVRLKSRNLS